MDQRHHGRPLNDDEPDVCRVVMRGCIGGGQVGLPEHNVVENRGCTIDALEGPVGHVLKAPHAAGVIHRTTPDKFLLDGIEAHGLPKFVFVAIRNGVLQPIVGRGGHPGFRLEDKEFIVGAGFPVSDELEADDIAALGRVIAVPALLIAQLARAPVAQDVFDVIGDQYLPKVARAQARAGNLCPIRQQGLPQVFRIGQARAIDHDRKVFV